MPIGRHPLRCVTNNVDCLLEELLCCIHIVPLTQRRINQIAVTINRSREGAPVPIDFDVCFLEVPRSPYLSLSFGLQLVRKQRGKTRLRVQDCLLCELKATL